MAISQDIRKEHACSHEGNELIHVDCASHVYPDGSRGIHEMCFRVLGKEIVALCGPNGSGKSTLIEHLNGLLKPTSGDVTFMGKKLDLGHLEIWKDVGVVFQRSDDQLFAPTVLDDVMFGPLNMGMSADQARAVALEALKAVGAGHLSEKIPGYMSGGQKRLVGIAGVLAMKPRVIAMDEPTSDLDPLHSEIVENIILSLRDAHGISVVVATHDMDMAARIADRICIVKNGSIVAEGKPADIFYDRSLLEGAGLRQPGIVRLYEDILKSGGCAPDRRPITAGEFIEAVSPLIKKK